MDMLHFASDYQEGAHPAVMRRLCETNLQKSAGYGADEFCAAARGKIRAACGCPNAAVHFLVGGTQTNAAVIDALLRSYQGVLAAESGHISVHEAGAVEFGGHKVLTLPHELGKISADAIRKYCETYWGDENREHMVMPGMVYLSQPTEYGTLCSHSAGCGIGVPGGGFLNISRDSVSSGVVLSSVKKSVSVIPNAWQILSSVGMLGSVLHIASPIGR